MSKCLERLISSMRLPTLFIGSGLSKRYLKDYPNWEELIDQLREEIGVSKTAFNAKKSEFKNSDSSISAGKLNQKMASYLQEKLLNKIENDDIDISTLFTEEENSLCIQKNIDYFKMLVAKHTLSYEIDENKKEEIEKLQSISQKTSMVFTTNYDLFLQNEVFKNFKVYESQDKYYFRTNNSYGELYKIHGCAKEPNSIIFCENDYDKFNNSLKLISSKLLNALMDFPIIFLGYSLEDDNIQKIMTDFVNSFDNDILQEIKKYMILVVYEKGQKDLIEGEKQFADAGTGKVITLTTIKTDNFLEIYNYIDKLQPSATTYELRKYKTMVADIINKTAKGEKKVYAQEIDAAHADEIALYIGSKQTVENIEKSTSIYKNEDIIEKALLGEDFDYDLFAQKWYNNKGISSTEYTPVFLIKNKMTVDFEQCCEKFKSNYTRRKAYFDLEFKPKSGNIANYDALINRYTSLKNENRTAQSLCDSICNDAMRLLHNETISIEQYENFLKRILQDFKNESYCSSFKKAACFMWYVEYEK